MIVKERDKNVLEFISTFHVAKTMTLAELFYPSLRYAQHRLKQMYDNKLLKRDRDHFTSQYYYYIKKPKQLRHRLIVTDFYLALNRIATIEKFTPEFTVFEGIRPDAFIAYIYKGKPNIAFLEVELSNNGFDIWKYEKLYKSDIWKKYFPVFPTIIGITNKSISKTFLSVIQINEDMENLKEVL